MLCQYMCVCVCACVGVLFFSSSPGDKTISQVHLCNTALLIPFHNGTFSKDARPFQMSVPITDSKSNFDNSDKYGILNFFYDHLVAAETSYDHNIGTLSSFKLILLTF